MASQESAAILPDESINVTSDDNPAPDNDAKLQMVRERFQIHQTFWNSIHTAGLDDDKFVAGEHWPKNIKDDRKEDHRPCLTYNLFPSFIRQITNKVRQNRPQLKVVPVESNKGASPTITNVQGTKDYSMADVYAGIIRNIEHRSRADQIYDTALKHAADHGFGYFYLMADWSPADPFVQELTLHRVKSSYSVYLDPDANQADFRDAQDAFIFTTMKKKTFKKKYPEARATEFAGPLTGDSYQGWYDKEGVRIAQYYWIDHKDDEVLLLSNGMTVYLSDVKDVLDEMEEEQGIYIEEEPDSDNKDGGVKQIRKSVKRPVCMWQKMTASDILEGPLELPFSAIPIFPVLGEEQIVDGRTAYISAIRDAKDPQRSYNYWRTAAAETVALAPRAPWMLTPKQLKGHEYLFESANTRNLPYLLYNHIDGVPQPQRNFPTQAAAAELANATQDGADMQSIIGLHDANLGKQSNEKSGKAIRARQDMGSTSTYQFPDNLNRAIEQSGRLMVEAIPKIYDTQRIMRIRLIDGADDFVEINKSITDKTTGKTSLVHDIGYGRYDVVIETGPSYATQRQEAADLQIELLKVIGPDKAANIMHLIIKNLGVPGSDEVAKVMRKMLPDDLKSEEEKLEDLPRGVTFDEQGNPVNEDGTPYQPPPTPELIAMQKQQEIEELQANVAKEEAAAKMATADADKIQAQAKIKAAEADLAKIQAEAQASAATDDAPARDDVAMLGEVQKIIEEVVRDHELNESAHADGIGDRVADAVVEALTRVKAYVDQKLPIPVPAESPPGQQEHNFVLKLQCDNGSISGATIKPINDPQEGAQ